MKSIDQMTGMEKVASLLIAIGPDAASRVLKYLDEDSIRKIVVEIAKVDSLSIEEKEEMIGEFLLEFKRNQGTLSGGETVARNLLVSAFGEEKAEEVFTKLTRKDLERGFAFLRDVDSEILASFLENEHLQTITVTLAYLSPHKSAEVLNRFQPYIAKEVSKRMARLGKTSPEAVLEIVRFIKKKYEKLIESSNNYEAPDGVNAIVDILNRMSLDQEKRLMEYFDTTIPQIADNIRERIFSFENVVNLSHQEVQILIDEVNDDHIISKALKGAGDEIRFKFLRNMSRNRATDVLSDMFNMGPLSLAEIKDARHMIASIMISLNDNGMINIRKEREKYVE
ncbi:MAG: flagellar motor switch protein FliG [Spirochaetota bacterium]|nr:flagellar motor switch protein FliG [Spirochaetota bacterium]